MPRVESAERSSGLRSFYGWEVCRVQRGKGISWMRCLEPGPWSVLETPWGDGLGWGVVVRERGGIGRRHRESDFYFCYFLDTPPSQKQLADTRHSHSSPWSATKTVDGKFLPQERLGSQESAPNSIALQRFGVWFQGFPSRLVGCVPPPPLPLHFFPSPLQMRPSLLFPILLCFSALGGSQKELFSYLIELFRSQGSRIQPPSPLHLINLYPSFRSRLIFKPLLTFTTRSIPPSQLS